MQRANTKVTFEEPVKKFNIKPYHEILYDPLAEVPKAEIIRKRSQVLENIKSKQKIW